MMGKLVPIVILAAAASCLLVVSAELEIEEKSFSCNRLPSNVVPTGYELELEFQSETTYEGHVNISLRFPHNKDADYEQLLKGLEGETCKLSGSNTIYLHADPSVNLHDINVSSKSCGTLNCFTPGEKKRSIRSIKRDSAKQLIAIKLWKGINEGSEGRVSIKFSGQMRNDKRGIYVSKYTANNKEEYKHIVSQFQPTDARLVFPVFDEPRFKARFQVRIVHFPHHTALSNTEVESRRKIEDINRSSWPLIETTFKQTPPMSVHMLALTVGRFDKPLEFEVESAFEERNYKVRVYTARGLRESGQFALEVARGSLQYFEDYIDHPYPLEKLDIVAIADHDKDNTESWGLAFIRDSLVLIDDETKPETKITTAINVAHVCVHQWFGNLVTAAWWNDLWITEGVAAQFAFRIVSELYPQFEIEYFVRLETLCGAMQLDAPGDKHALSPPLDDLRTSEQIRGLFDNLEFMKSASLAHMVSYWMGSERGEWYQKFLGRLLKAHIHETVTRNDYVNAISNSVADGITEDELKMTPNIIKLVDSFSPSQGVPLINVQLEDGRLKVDVELMNSARKDIAGPEKEQTQFVLVYDIVPVHYRDAGWGTLPYKLHGISSDRALTRVDSSIQWVKVGLHSDIHNYYRVRYSSAAYQALCEPIKARRLDAMNRLHIIDDANVLTRAHLISGDTFKQLVDCYADEDHGAVLLELISSLITLESLKLSTPSSETIERLFEKHGFAVSGQETLIEQRSRSIGLKWLIAKGNQQVIEATLKAFDAGPVALFFREPVYTTVVLYGTGAQVNKLKARLNETKSYEEKLRLANALSHSSDKNLLIDLRIWLKDESGLSEDVIKPLLDLIESKVWQKN